MSERIWSVFCGDDCKAEGLTKEQILAAIAQATGQTTGGIDVDAAFISKLKEDNESKTLRVWQGTYAEYNAVATKDANTLYIIDGTGNNPPLIGGNNGYLDDSLNAGSLNAVRNSAITAGLNGKVDKVDGKGLSTNDYTTAEKTKLSGIAGSAQVNILESVKVNGIALPITSKAVNVTVPTKVSDITNDSGFITGSGNAATATKLQIARNITITGAISGEASFDGSSNVSITANININAIYPINSIYMSISPTSPASLFGGAWERIKDKFLLSAGDTYSGGSTGGEASHTLTIAEMPIHGHTVLRVDGASMMVYYESVITSGSRYSRLTFNGDTNATGYEPITNSVGGSQSHNNLPPYLTVYIWKRTA